MIGVNRILALGLSASMLAATSCTFGNTAGPSDRDALYVGSKLALSYEHRDFDPAQRSATCKVYHHVYAPDGRLLTKGLGGEFEHHRGLFFGFNQTRTGAQQLDFWHCRNGETQRHRGYVDASEMGLDPSWTVAAVDWLDRDERTIVEELRAIRVRAFDEATWCIDVRCQLKAPAQVHLGGDPQHSGHQFRALDRFAAKNATKVTYVRPDAATSHGEDIWTGCDWIAAVLPFQESEGPPVTVVRVEAKTNPHDVRWSTRDYGRFGATFAHTLERGAALTVDYHYVIALGTASQERCAALAAASVR